MDKATDANASSVKLDSLSIRGFRGIEELDIRKLGRVTLIAGKNGVGKTTVLDAVRVYAARGQFDALKDILNRREEWTTALRDEYGQPALTPAFDRLFHRNSEATSTVEIGPCESGPKLKIKDVKDYSCVPDTLSDQIYDHMIDDVRDINDAIVNIDDVKLLSVSFDDARVFLPWQLFAHQDSRSLRSFLRSQEKLAAPVPCVSLGPGLLDNYDLAKLWDEVALRDDESLGLEALRLVFGSRVERTAAIGERYDPGGRRVVVKLSSSREPVPLKSLGDGASRMFGVVLALANYRNGILLIDEAENGIHYTVQSKFWEMILRAAEMHNVQILATTHSKDCIDGFAAAALECPDVDGNLVHIRWHKGKMRAVNYSTEELDVAAEQDIEVR